MTLQRCNMTSIEKNTIKNFLNLSVPYEFMNSTDKLLFNEFLKGICYTFVKTSRIDGDTVKEIVSLKNELYRDIDLSDNENFIYFCFVKLTIAIMKKYS